jgi:hypothetical protein
MDNQKLAAKNSRAFFLNAFHNDIESIDEIYNSHLKL